MFKFITGGDRAVIERIRRNDRRVLGELFVDYEKLIVNHIRANGGNLDDAQDILQETIIVLWQNVISGKFELTSKISTYLVAVAKNKWLVELRRRKRLVDDNPVQQMTDGNPSLLEQMVDDEHLERVRQALDQIQPICKQILLLFYFEERSMEEIAKMMNFSNMNVAKSKKYQCKKALQEVISQLMPEERRM